MLATTLLAICDRSIELGLARSKADFSRVFLGRYGRYIELTKRRGLWVPQNVCKHLLQILELATSKCPISLARDVQDLLDQARHGLDVAQVFRR